MTNSYTLFDTPIGRCGIAWGERGVVAVNLPEDDDSRIRARLAKRCSSAVEAAPPPQIQQVIDRIVALLGGERVDLSDVALDLASADDFERRVYDIALKIPAGRTKTYGEIALALGDRLLAQDVGKALGRNPIPIIVPCHRVLAAGGKAGGFSAHGGVNTKLKLLTIEGAEFVGEPAAKGKSTSAKPTSQLSLFD